MFKLSEIAPAIQAEIDAHNKAMAEHREACREDVCMQCGRVPERSHEDRMKAIDAVGRATVLARIPSAFAEATFDADWLAKLVGAETVERARRHGNRSAAFIGPPGAGKTSLVAAMFRAAVETSKRPRWFRWTSAYALAKARASAALGDEAPLVQQAFEADLLVIDELGGEQDRHATAVAEVIYERHAENRPMWITTGVAPKVIADRYGGGIARRVFEGAEVFRLGGKR